ncbi:MAG: acyl-CoA synthetase [Alphaproteobacteria bacterium]|nr:acyl-CoA synthetase [Alphaproteobacteria bacterium]
MSRQAYETDLDKNAANFQALTPLSFLPRTALTFPDRLAVIHGERRLSWAQVHERARRLASALAKRGIKRGDTVAIMSPNTPAMFEAHFGVPMTGAVLNTLNTRLDGPAIAFILDHGEAKVLLTDRELSPIIEAALKLVKTRPVVIDIDDMPAAGGKLLGEIEYEAFIAGGDAGYVGPALADEWEAISLNYTSGTTGNPKGVVYHHRGAYLNALGNAISWGMGQHPVYLWTLPMFHCNGWCFPWTITALAGTNVCLRRVDSRHIYQAIAEHQATHLSGAPIVMQMICNASETERTRFNHQVQVMTAAAPPPASVLAAMQRQGFKVTHVYGLTETYGPCVVSAWHEEWDGLDIEQQARLKARQGVPYEVQDGLMVADAKTLKPVPRDGETMGEVFMRGNIVMKGYLKNAKATREAFAGGWFHSGDLGVWHADGYIELKDRSKDIIISGGENISSIEVEGVLYRHPAVAFAAVVAKPDEKWGETPVAFVELKPGASASEAEIVQFCRDNLAHFKCPRAVVFTEVPKTSTGKIQKFLLRDKAKTA